jgi:hypothetical protein
MDLQRRYPLIDVPIHQGKAPGFSCTNGMNPSTSVTDQEREIEEIVMGPIERSGMFVLHLGDAKKRM